MDKKEEQESCALFVQKDYKPVEIKAKNAPYGSYAAGCRVTYGDCENCYICDMGG